MAPIKSSIFLLLASSLGILTAQTLMLERADRFTVINAFGRSVTQLRGNVKLVGPDGLFACDSADWHRGENRFFAYSNVRFTGQTGTVIQAKNLEYLNGEAYFSGGVSVRDGEQTLQTSSLRYDTKSQRGIFSQRAYARTADGSLTCRRGEFNHETYRFLGDVKWLGAEERLHCEVMEYLPERRTLQLPQGGQLASDGDSVVFGQGVLALSGRRKMVLSGGVQGWGALHQFRADQWSRWPDSDQSIWLGNAYLMDWERDTTELWAHHLLITADSISARGGAVVRMPSWSGSANRWLGHRRDSTYILDGEPVIWSGSYQILAQTFHVNQTGPGDSLWADLGVHLGTKADSLGRSDQMAAETLRAKIRDRRMLRMDLETNAQALFYPDSNMSSSMRSARIQLTFMPNGELDEVRFVPSPSGSAVKAVEPLFLPGYKDRWNEQPPDQVGLSSLN